MGVIDADINETDVEAYVFVLLDVCTTCNTDPVGNVLFGMDCNPVMVEPATDEI